MHNLGWILILTGGVLFALGIYQEMRLRDQARREREARHD